MHDPNYEHEIEVTDVSHIGDPLRLKEIASTDEEVKKPDLVEQIKDQRNYLRGKADAYGEIYEMMKDEREQRRNKDSD